VKGRKEWRKKAGRLACEQNRGERAKRYEGDGWMAGVRRGCEIKRDRVQVDIRVREGMKKGRVKGNADTGNVGEEEEESERVCSVVGRARRRRGR
jgi:hypothetical protein